MSVKAVLFTKELKVPSKILNILYRATKLKHLGCNKADVAPSAGCMSFPLTGHH